MSAMNGNRMLRHSFLIAALSILISIAPWSARAAHDFAGKQIRLIVPAGPGGGYALYGQLAAQHLGRFIPGKPTVVISYMPGGFGLNAMNYLYEVAPRDGTVIAVMQQDLATQQVLGTKGIRFDATKFNYIGRATANVPVHIIWNSAPVNSIEDLRRMEVLTGAVGAGGTHNDLPNAQNTLLQTRWRVIGGYKSNREILLALERGEVQAAIVPATLLNKRLRSWVSDKKIKVIVQYADFRHPAFPDIPSIVDLAGDQEATAIFRFLVSLSTIGRSYGAPPGVPATTLGILRKAFSAMIQDREFLADAQKRGADLLPMAGEKLSVQIRRFLATSPSLVRKAKHAIRQK